MLKEVAVPNPAPPPNTILPSLDDVSKEARMALHIMVTHMRRNMDKENMSFKLDSDVFAAAFGVPVSSPLYTGCCQNLALWASSSYQDFDFTVLTDTRGKSFTMLLTPVCAQTQTHREEAKLFRDEVLSSIRAAGGEEGYRRKYPKRAQMLDKLPDFDWTMAYKRHRRN